MTGIQSGQYRYTDDLLCLNSCRPTSMLQLKHHPLLQEVSTPLIFSAWKVALAAHPDCTYYDFILSGLSGGFRIDFNHAQQLLSAKSNMRSAILNPSVIDEYNIIKEKVAGRFVGSLQPAVDIQLSRFRVIPKGHIPGKWRLITDLSHPPGLSVNDSINKEMCSLSYVMVDTVAAVVASLGLASLMAKVAIQSAYRVTPIHHDDRPLLGVHWRGEVLCDVMLPFGLRSAPKLFNAVADALEWCICQAGVTYIYHYLDNFIVVSPPSSSRCSCDLAALKSVCASLGVPLAVNKEEGPTICLTFLGIEIDSVAAELRLPGDKLQRLLSTVSEWGDKKVCLRKELESLIGVFNHACKVVRPGRTFLRRMIDRLSATVSPSGHSRPTHHIRLDRVFRADLAWWKLFVQERNGVGLLPSNNCSTDEGPVVMSDASGGWGCGAWCGSHWFQHTWTDEEAVYDISVKELTPVVVSAAVWCNDWVGKCVTCYSDNQAVVAVANKQSCRDQCLMHLLRCLFYFEAHYQFIIHAKHITVSCNDKADDLSRNNLSAFLSKVPNADSSPAQAPTQLYSLLLSQELDWLSPDWQRQFSTILDKV